MLRPVQAWERDNISYEVFQLIDSDVTDQILALIIPDIEETKKRIGTRLLGIIDRKEFVDTDTIRELRLYGQALQGLEG